MPGDHAWPTQPIPTIPPPFARQKMTADDVNPYILTPQERTSWKDRIGSMRNEGLFTPPGLYESLSLPGARGGANWGSTAANPAKGMVYLTTQDWPTIYKLSLEDPFAARPDGGRSANSDAGKAAYEQRCQYCHGIKGIRSGSGPPALARAGARLGFDAFRQVVLSCRAEMPAFPDLDNATLSGILTLLGNAGDTAAAAARSATVVASAGAPGGLELRPPTGPRYSQLGGPPYPKGLDAPGDRYYTCSGLYPDQPFVISPPWTSIGAYD